MIKKHSPGAVGAATGALKIGPRQNRRNYRCGLRCSQLPEVVALLAVSTEALALDLLGQPTTCTRTEMRFGAKGSLLVNIGGDRAGRWFSFELGRGGDALDLIAFAHNCDLRSALRWARQWTGGRS